MSWTRTRVTAALFALALAALGGCHGHEPPPLPPASGGDGGTPAPPPVALTPLVPMQPGPPRPASCTGLECPAVCSPIPAMGPGLSIYNGPNPPWNGLKLGLAATGDLDGDGLADVVVSDPPTGEVGV